MDQKVEQTLETLYLSIRERLKPVTASPQQADVEAGLIWEHVLGLSQSDRYVSGTQAVSENQMSRVEHFLAQRVGKRIPVQYLLHEAWFYGMRFYVNPHVLIPRPETELLVEEALGLAESGMRIADIGTGPGSIAIALAHKLGDSVKVYGTELSEAALKVALINQKSLKTNVTFLQGDLLAPLPTGKTFDWIISNPPYIDPALRPVLDAEVACHEPEMALFPPSQDAFHYYHRLAAEASDYLKPGGYLMVEVGAGMAGEVRTIFEAAGFEGLRVIPDFAGIERIVLGMRPA